jgi:diguanylate cyclase (GGDEF)-like protein
MQDIACRYGGEEFTLILPDSSLDEAAKRASQVRTLAGTIQVIHRGALLEPITFSIGVASFPQHGSSASEILREADTALYLAKNAGRDQVISAPLNRCVGV